MLNILYGYGIIIIFSSYLFQDQSKCSEIADVYT